MITCLFIGGILACEIIKVVAIIKTCKKVKEFLTIPEEEIEE